MKIVFVSYTYWPPNFGGGLLHTIERLESLTLRDHSVTALTAGVPGYESNECINGIFILRSRLQRQKNKFQKILHRLVYFVWCILQLITRDYEVAHIGSLPGFDATSSAICGSILARIIHHKKARVVFLYSLAETEKEVIVFKGVKGRIRQSFFKKIDFIVVNSPGLYKEMVRFFPSTVRLIINGVKDETFSSDVEVRKKIRLENHVKDDEVIFAFLGTIGSRKGVDVLLNVFEELNNENKKLKLWLIGPFEKKDNQNIDEETESNILECAKEMVDVKLWGRIDDRNILSGLLNSCDIFVFPTRREGMPMAPLQAMAVGLPLIISLIPGITDVANVEDVTGLFVKPGDNRTLRRAMSLLANDKDLRQKMGLNSRRRIEDAFSWQKHVECWEHLYLDSKIKSNDG